MAHESKIEWTGNAHVMPWSRVELRCKIASIYVAAHKIQFTSISEPSPFTIQVSRDMLLKATAHPFNYFDVYATVELDADRKIISGTAHELELVEETEDEIRLWREWFDAQQQSVELGGERFPSEPIPMALDGCREADVELEPDEMGF